MSKRLTKYIASFDYFGKSLVVLSATSGSISIASFATIIGTHVGTAGESASFTFSMSTGLAVKLIKTTRNKKRSIIKLLCWLGFK